MLIREVEKLTGIKDVNIRYYEKEGLIHPERKANGYREYSEADVELIRQIKVLRLLDVPVPEIRQVINNQITLQEVIQKRLTDLNDEEIRLKEIRTSCENILSENISISNLNEGLLYGNRSTWKVRLEEIMKKDIDKKFIGNSVIYIVIWALLAKVIMASMMADSWNSMVTNLNSSVTGMVYYVSIALAMFLILYGIGLTVYEALTGKGFLWVWGRDWGGGGLGGLANSFTFLGIGIGIMGTNWIRFFALLIIICVLSALIRSYFMYRNNRSEHNVPVLKNNILILIICIFLIIIYVIFVVILFNNAKNDISVQNNTKTDISIDKDNVKAIEITPDNWDVYFEHKDNIVYEENNDGDITTVYLDSWIQMKQEYYDQLVEGEESKVFFKAYYKRTNKEYKIIDTKTGEYEIIGNAPSNDYFYGLLGEDTKVIFWDNLYDDPYDKEYDDGRTNYAPLYLDHSNKKPYMEIYDDFKIKAVEGTIYLKK
ncbi:MAG: MerR family transcriptional regulator [Lachnospiraceae bacterium]